MDSSEAEKIQRDSMYKSYGQEVEDRLQSVRELQQKINKEEALKMEAGHGEIERLVIDLQDSLNRLDENSYRIVEKTADFAAMDRAVPDVGDVNPREMPETRFGNILQEVIDRVNIINNRINDHCYKLET